MPSTYTPLRYPGGKTKLYSFVREILASNGLIGKTYCEPFAGGAGLTIKLLIKQDVNNVILNDADPAIYSFWYAVLNQTEELCEFIDKVDVSVAEWEKQKNVYLENSSTPNFDLACATFFLNRTNISGVITGGVIGGKQQQGKYGIGARFNKDDLKEKIRRIAADRDHIELYNLDVLDFIEHVLNCRNDEMLVNFDPPYVNKGGQLYKNAFTHKDHEILKEKIRGFDKKWIVTYDICDLVEQLYSEFRGGKIQLYYSANNVRKAEEFIFYSNNLIIPEQKAE